MASASAVKIPINASEVVAGKEAKEGLLPQLKKSWRHPHFQGNGGDAANNGSQSARKPVDDRPKNSRRPPAASSAASGRQVVGNAGGDSRRTPRPPSASGSSAAAPGETAGSSSLTSGASITSSRAISPMTLSVNRKIVSNKGMSFDISGKGASFDASGKHSRVTSFELDLSDETVAEDVAIIKAAIASQRRQGDDDIGPTHSDALSRTAHGGLALTREEVEELVKGEEAAKQADGGESNEEVNEDEAARRRMVRGAAGRILRIMSVDSVGVNGGRSSPFSRGGARTAGKSSRGEQTGKLDEKQAQAATKQLLRPQAAASKAYLEGLKIKQEAEQELRALKMTHKETLQAKAQVTADKKAAEAALAETEMELKKKEDECYKQAGVIEKLEAKLENLKVERDALGKELAKSQRQSEGYRSQLGDEKASFTEFKAKKDKEFDILEQKERHANQKALEHHERLRMCEDQVLELDRDKRRLDEGMSLEKSAAQLERATCDKYRVRVAELEQQWADALRAKDAAEAQLKMTRHELEEARSHLAESAIWHNARVHGRRTTRTLLALPQETQDIALSQQGLKDHDAVMVSEFLINNLMIVSCDISNNDIGPQGATALAQGLVNNRVLTSLNLKDNLVGPEGCRKLAMMLAGNRVMERLNLMGCDVGDEGCRALAEVLSIPQCTIQLLALRFNGITDAGAEAMSIALETNSTLTELGLNSNHITDDGIAALTVSLSRNTTLELLRLTENPYGRESLKRLTNAKRDGLHLYF